MENTGIRLEKEELFRTEEVLVEPDFAQTKDYVVAAFDKAIKLEKENKELLEKLEEMK